MAVIILLHAKTITQTGVTIMATATQDLIIIPTAVILSIIGCKIMAAIARTLVILPLIAKIVSVHGAKIMERTDMVLNRTVFLITKNVSVHGVQAIQAAMHLVIHPPIMRG